MNSTHKIIDPFLVYLYLIVIATVFVVVVVFSFVSFSFKVVMNLVDNTALHIFDT